MTLVTLKKLFLVECLFKPIYEGCPPKLTKNLFLSKICFYDIKFSFLRGNVSVTTIQRFRFYDVKFAFLYRNGNAV